MKIANPYCIRLIVKSIYLLVFLIGAICGYVSYAYIDTAIHYCCSEDAKTLPPNFSHDPDGLDLLQRRLYGNKSSSNSLHMTSTGITEENDTQHFQTNHAAEELEKRFRVICWITIDPDRYIENGSHIKATWGERCNRLLFTSTDRVESLAAINSSRVNEFQHWDEMKEAFEHIHTQYSNYDYVLKANDDTYVILENLRLMLTSFDPDDPFYISCKFSIPVKLGHTSGVADYVLSKEAVRRFVNVSIPLRKYPQDNKGADHFEIGKYFESIGIKAVSRDIVGSGRFLPYPSQDNDRTEHKYLNSLFWKHIYNPIKKDMDCCSNNGISFHNVPSGSMYVLDYLIYHLRPYGVCESVHNINTIDSKKKRLSDSTKNTTC